MKFTATTVVALGLSGQALAGFGTCTSPVCSTTALSSGLFSSKSIPTASGGHKHSKASASASISASGTGNGTWLAWESSTSSSSSVKATSKKAKGKSTSSSISSSGTPVGPASVSSPSSTPVGPASASSSSTGGWGSYSASSSTPVGPASVSSSSSTPVGPASASSTPASPVSSVCSACTSYAANGDSWASPSCVAGSASVSGSGSGSGSGAGGRWSSQAISTINTNVYPTLTLATNSVSVSPSATSSPNSTVASTCLSNNTCNAPGSRDEWCYGLDIQTDSYTSWPNTGAVCEYAFTITNTTHDYDGTPRLALAVNGQVPGPTIDCNWGDTVKITVNNALTDNGTTIHWHGVRQLGTNPNDGVPGVTECDLAPGDSRVYQWQATSYGTSWYHSHVVTQYGDGLQGPIIIRGPTSSDYDCDMGPVMISDLFNQTASQEYDNVVHNGPLGAANYLLNGQNALPDGSAGQQQLWQIESGKKYLFRIINSASQSGWRWAIDGHQLTVVATDFVPIVPYTTDYIDINIGQRYDVIIEANQAVGSYFMRAATQGACPSTCDNTAFGIANGIVRYKGASSALPTSTASFNEGDVAGICQDEPIASLVPVVQKSAGTSSAFSSSASVLPAGQLSTIATVDDGNVFRWYLNGNTMNIDPTNPTLEILAKAGNLNNSTFSVSENVAQLTTANTWVYFVIQNEFFAPHPMHLHGHTFALLGQGAGTFDPANMTSTLNFDSPPRRDTAMLAGSGYTVIAFETDNPGAWLMHCHIAWHVSGGLSMQFLERPQDIPAAKWALTEAFQTQCNNFEAYDQTATYQLLGGDSGLKVKRDALAGYSADVVRRSENSGKRYINHNLKRGLGDGHRHL